MQWDTLDQLWSEFKSGHDETLREQLIEAYRPMALSILRQFGFSGDEDLQQVALLGLVKAVDRFDPGLGYRFTTFAMPTIAGEIKRYFRDHSRPVRPPRALSELRDRVAEKEGELTRSRGRAPTLSEIADALGVALEQIVEAMALDDLCSTRSLDGVMESLELDRSGKLEDYFGFEDPAMERVVSRITWSEILNELDWPLCEVLRLRYFCDLTQAQVARRFGVSQMQISRWERRALDLLRGQFRSKIACLVFG